MDTAVNVQVISEQPRETIEAAVGRAFGWFETVERICTRFDPSSEVMRLIDQVGTPVSVSTLLFECIAFALDLAEQTGGAFDPSVGAQLERLGFNTNYRTGEVIHSNIQPNVSFQDVRVDRLARTVLLRKPLVLDLNAVAKGLAIDLARKALEDYADVCIEAGGDVYVRGHNADGALWHIGIQHPRAEGSLALAEGLLARTDGLHPRAEGLLARTLRLTDTAVCTSGDYERRTEQGQPHILDGRTHRPISDLASVTVVAPTAMAADGLSTAAMVLGRERGLRFLEQQGVGGLLITPTGEVVAVNL